MKKITYSIVLLLFLMVQISYSQETYKQIVVRNTSNNNLIELANQGIDLRCGASISKEGIVIEVTDNVLSNLDKVGINYSIKIEDMAKFYRERAAADMPNALSQLKAEKAKSQAKRFRALQGSSQNKSSIANTGLDNYLQDNNNPTEIDWGVPSNFNLGSMGGCLTVSETETEMAEMVTYASSLNIISPVLDASSETTYGNSYTGGGVYDTWSGKKVKYLRITGNHSTSPEGSKPQILFTSMIHSREAASLMQNIYFMWYLLENYEIDPAIKNLVDNNELYFIPIVNPDGLLWNEQRDPNGGGQQRKNLRPVGTNNSESRGVDVNRNFDYFWGADGTGSTNDPTDQTYRGPNPFSEPESRILRDFVLARNFKTVLMHHTAANGIPHPYGGNPSNVSGKEDEMHKWHEDMTKYNRYVSGATIFNPANGIADDWMLGGIADGGSSTQSYSTNNTLFDNSPPSVGSGQNILASTPEHGHSNEGGSGGQFWPSPSNFVPIAKRAVRLNLMNIYYGGKYAKLQDQTQSDINTITSDLKFGIERLGQTDSDFTLTLTPITLNTIESIASPATQVGMDVLEQRDITALLTLKPGLQPNARIEYKAQLANGDGVVFYEANYEKYYQPNVMLADNPDTGSLANWTATGGWTTTTATPFSGTRVIKDGSAVPYSNNTTKTLTTANAYDFSNSDEVLVQFYTKWDLERNYDFVELLASTDGTNWQPLDGNYNKPNSVSTTNDANFWGNKNSTSHAFQSSNSSGKVYDGDQMDKYVMEEIVINDTNNSFLKNQTNVSFRFRMRTDANNGIEIYNTTFTGFFIDDFKIIGVTYACETTIPTNVSITNITTVTAQADWDSLPAATYDLRYRETGSGSAGWTTITDIATNSYTINDLTPSTDYDVRIRTRCGTNTSTYTTITNFTTTSLVPCTGSSINTFPYSESFENTLGLWSNESSPADDFDWTNQLQSTGQPNGSTPSTGTGPDGASNGSYFLYTEASDPNFPSKTARLLSPCIDFSGRKNALFSFDYHMHGGFIGVLTLDVSTDNGASYVTLSDYTLSGNQQSNTTDAWKTQNIDLSPFDDQVIKLRISATTHSDASTGWSGDISIDNFGITSDIETNSASPNAVCQNITVQLDNTGNATIVASDIDGGSTDDVAITNYSIDISSFDCNNIGTPIDVTLTVTDADNQTDSCISTVTVVDELKPTFINFPSNIVLTCGNNEAFWTDPTASDNCDNNVNIIRTDGSGYISGDFFPNGATTISYSATDDYGNVETGSFTVTVTVDNENPIANCQNITVQLDANGNATITAAQINNNSTDDCAIASISASKTNFTCADAGPNNVTLTVNDANGNSNTCTAVVTITIQDAPTTACYETATYNNSSCTWVVTGTQQTEPTTACYETATFDTDENSSTYCTWVVTGTQQT
ncbi:M14 family zinc carboxypeptidase, partial [uncultured Lacinutrix sp.]|uniref:M14 family zinc carboxypeptidase n=1 Tax=uncultured Lacinutrix sp. TaxID=574032 RepID=UPI002618F546